MDKLQFNFADYLIHVFKYRWIFLTLTILFVFIGVYHEKNTRNYYSSSSSLILVPPKYQTQLRPAQFSIDVYKKLSLKKVLMEKLDKALPPDVLVIRGTGIDKKSSAPIIVLNVKSEDNVVATEQANLWARIFLKTISEFKYSGQSGSYEFISEEFQNTQIKLREAEKKYNQYKNTSGLTLKNGKRDILKKNLIKQMNMLSEMIDQKGKVEIGIGKELIQKLKKNPLPKNIESTVSILSKKIIAQTNKAIELDAEFIELKVNIEQTKKKLEECQSQQKTVEKYFEIEKININPVYLDLLKQISSLKIKMVGYCNLEKITEKKIEELNSKTIENSKMLKFEEEQLQIATYFSLKRSIEHLNKQILKKETKHNKICLEISVIETEENILLRSLDVLKRTNNELLQKYEYIRLAKAEDYSDFKIFEKAIIPTSKMKKQYFKRIIIYVLIIWILLLVIILLLLTLKPDYNDLIKRIKNN